VSLVAKCFVERWSNLTATQQLDEEPAAIFFSRLIARILKVASSALAAIVFYF